LPSPSTFFDEYLHPEKPVLFREAAKRMPAFARWTDKYLRERHGHVHLDQVETEKKETRLKYPKDDWTLSRFLSEYNTSDVYSTAATPRGLSDEVYLLPVLNCGGFTKRMSQSVLWFSSGSTKSVIHQDGQHNIHCMFAGEKHWILWRPDSGINTAAMGWVTAEEEAKTDPAFKDAYGTFAGRIDVDSVDVKRYPGWERLHWWSLTLRAGDCAFIPSAWFHYVEAPPQRSISVHVWFHSGKEFDRKSCTKLEGRGFNLSRFMIRLSDCSWGFGEDGKRKPTKCKRHRSLPFADGGEEPAKLPDEL